MSEVARLIEPRVSAQTFQLPDEYLNSLPTDLELDNLKVGDIVMLGVNCGLENTWFTEVFAVLIVNIEDNLVTGSILNNMSLTIAHGLRIDKTITFYDDYVFKVLTEEEYLEEFE